MWRERKHGRKERDWVSDSVVELLHHPWIQMPLSISSPEQMPWQFKSLCLLQVDKTEKIYLFSHLCQVHFCLSLWVCCCQQHCPLIWNLNNSNNKCASPVRVSWMLHQITSPPIPLHPITKHRSYYLGTLGFMVHSLKPTNLFLKIE